jgi:hypothetical protein
MSTISHGTPGAFPEPRASNLRALRDMWASLAIMTIWLAVLADAIWGPDFVSTSSSSMTKIPSAIILGLFAWLATKAVAKYGFGGHDSDRKSED